MAHREVQKKESPLKVSTCFAWMLQMKANVVMGVNSILKKEGRLDVLVNNAGLGMADHLKTLLLRT